MHAYVSETGESNRFSLVLTNYDCDLNARCHTIKYDSFKNKSSLLIYIVLAWVEIITTKLII